MWRRLGIAVLACAPGLLWAAPESGVEMQFFDKSVRAQDDFYRHVNGLWLNTKTIPDDKSNYSAFSEISDRTEKQLFALIKEAAKTQALKGQPAQQIGDLYASFMDEAAAEKLGLSALDADLMQIERLNQHSDIPSLMATLDMLGAEGLVNGYISRDAKQPDQYILYLYQGGLGLPDREYYLDDNKKFKQLRQSYRQYVTDLLSLAGTVNAAGYAEKILALETRIAGYHWTNVQNRDAEKTYNRRDLDTLNTSTPGFDLRSYLSAAGIHGTDAVVLYEPSYFEAIGSLIKSAEIDVWREYFRLKLISSYAPYLNKAFVDLHFNFYSKALSGINANKPRWKRGVASVEHHVGELLGQLYVAKHFPAAAKKRMQDMVDNIISAYRVSIRELDWMSEKTKREALKKLAAFTPKIGYPDKWEDYSDLRIEADDLIGNIRRSRLFAHHQQLDKLGGPIDPNEWHMTPQTVNAYYSPTANEIVFPAAILQAPFFNLEADDAINYGGIGSVIGHEIGHGFDDQGSRYDGTGELNNWWSEEDRKRFEQRTSLLIEQYAGYEPLPGFHINGELTIGENIGDLGGLSIAAKAYEMAQAGKPDQVLDGYTGMQRLMIGWAQVWRWLYRDEELIKRIKADTHSPGEYRCNGTVANVPQFYRAFDVKEGDALYRAPEKRVKIW